MIGLTGLLAIFSVDIVYFVARAYTDVLDDAYDQTFGNKFMRTIYIFHAAELWGVVVLGSMLVISMLKRQAFPPHVCKRENCTVNRGYRVNYVDEGAQGDEIAGDEIDEAKRNSSSKLANTRVSGMSVAANTWRTPAHLGDSTTSHLPLTGCTNSIHPADTTVECIPANLASPPTVPATEEEDVSWYAGYGTGRSIVLQALANSTDVGMRRVRKAAWRTQTPETSNTHNDIESLAVCEQKFATPHGLIGPASPSRPTSILPPEPTLRHKASNSNASSVYS